MSPSSREWLSSERRPGRPPPASGKNAIFDIILAMRVCVLALDDVFDLGLSAVLDAFQTANELIEHVRAGGAAVRA